MAEKVIVFKLRVDTSEAKKIGAFEERIKDVGKSVEDIPKNMKAGFAGMPGMLTTFFVTPFKGALNSVIGLASKAFKEIAGFTKDLFVNAVTDSISLEDAMAGVRKTAGLSAEEVGSLTREVRDFSVEALGGMVEAGDLASALEIAGQQGVFAGKSFEQGSKDALAFAKTMVIAGDVFGGLSTEKAAEGLGLLHGRFSDVIPDIENAASVINYFGDNTKRSEGFILKLAGRMAEVGATMGLTEASTISIAATLGNLNQAGEKSGTAMNRIFNKMRFDSTQFAEAFQLDAERFKQLAATDMEGALLLLSGQLNKLGESREGLDVIGAALTDLRLTGDGVRTTMLGLGANYTTLQENLVAGRQAWDENTSAMNSFIDGTDRVSKLWAAMKTIWTNTAGVLSDMLLPVFKSLLIEINLIAAEFREWLLSSAFVTDVLPAALKSIEFFLKGVLREALEVIEAFDWSAAWENTKASLASAWDTLKGIVQTIASHAAEFSFEDAIQGGIAFVKAVTDIAGAIDAVVKAAGVVKKAIEDAGTAVGTWVEQIGAVKVFETAWEGVLLIIEGIVDLLNGDFEAGLKRLGEGVVKFVSIPWEALKGTIQTIWDWAIEYGTNALKQIGESITDVFSQIGEFFTGSGGGAEDFNNSLLQGMKDVDAVATDLEGTMATLTDAQKELHAAGNAYGDDMVYNSVLPDISEWLGRNKLGVQALGAEFEHLNTQINRYSPPVTIANAAYQAPTSPTIARPTTTTPTAATTPGRTVTQTIVFQGTNIVDPSSQERFARAVGTALTGLSSQSVRAV